MNDNNTTILKWRNVEIGGHSRWLWPEVDHWGWEQPFQEYPALLDLLLSNVRGRRVIVQAGGCCGMYPMLFADHFETVYTFEPDPTNFFCLSVNCAETRIIRLQAALGSARGTTGIIPGPEFNVGMHKVGGAGKIPMLCLDDLGLENVDAIQLDCESYEPQVLLGALNTIKYNRPVLVIEGPNEDLRNAICDLGYAVVGECGSNPPNVGFAPRLEA